MNVFYNRRRDVYQCGELEKFHETVLERMELLPVERVAEILNGFLEQYGFSVIFVIPLSSPLLPWYFNFSTGWTDSM